jgi:hypothetical protein
LPQDHDRVVNRRLDTRRTSARRQLCSWDIGAMALFGLLVWRGVKAVR